MEDLVIGLIKSEKGRTFPTTDQAEEGPNSLKSNFKNIRQQQTKAGGEAERGKGERNLIFCGISRKSGWKCGERSPAGPRPPPCPCSLPPPFLVTEISTNPSNKKRRAQNLPLLYKQWKLRLTKLFPPPWTDKSSHARRGGGVLGLSASLLLRVALTKRRGWDGTDNCWFLRVRTSPVEQLGPTLTHRTVRSRSWWEILCQRLFPSSCCLPCGRRFPHYMY